MAYNDRRLIARLFDEDQKLISPRSQLIGGKQLKAGDPIPDHLDKSTRLKLWMTRRAVYESDWSPTPIAGPVPKAADPDPDTAWLDRADGVEVIAGDNSWYQIKADWLDETVSAHGEDAAKEKAAELRAAPAYVRAGVSVDHTGGGYYAIAAAWLDEPEKVKGKDEAAARAAEIAEARPADDQDGDSSNVDGGSNPEAEAEAAARAAEAEADGGDEAADDEDSETED